MSAPPQELLYNLLPAVYRQRDIETGGQLRALMAVLELQYRALTQNIAALYDNFFIDSCAEWLVPYLGAQLGVTGLGDPDLLFPEQRALVGNAIAWRRRKGTPAVLQPLIRAASGWYATASEAPVGTVSIGLCRLPVFGAGPTPATPAPIAGSLVQRFAFDPLGLSCPLYNVPLLPLPATETAPQALLPLPITNTWLAQDLAGYDAAYGAWPAALQPPDSALYGPGRGLSVTVSGQAVPPTGIVVMDLSQGAMPPAGFPLFASAPLASVPALPEDPEVEITIGTEGPYMLSLVGELSSLADIAASLQKAIQTASSDPVFTTAQVVAASNALLVVPGGFAPLVILFGPTTSDPQTATLLGLTVPTPVIAVQSGTLTPFPSLPASGTLSLLLTIGSTTAAVAPALPITDVGQLAKALEAAIQAASTDAGFADAAVLAGTDSILVLPGAIAVPVAPATEFVLSFADGADAATLQLLDLVGLDPEHGYLALPTLAAPGVPSVRYGYGFPWAIGGGPYDRPGQPPAPGTRVYPAGSAAPYPTLTEALQSWSTDQPGTALILISDNGAIDASGLAITLSAGQSLTLAAAPQLCPALTATAPITLAGPAGSRVAFDGLLIGAGISIADDLAVDFADCTLYPPASGVSIDAATGAAPIAVTLTRALAGAIILPSGVALTVTDSVIGNIGAALATAPVIAGSTDGKTAGPVLTIERATIFGAVNAAAITTIGDTLFNQPVAVTDTTAGLFRYSYVPPGSAALPQSFCQPLRALQQAAAQLDVPLSELPPAVVAQIEQQMTPVFVGGAYPAPFYAQLADGNAPELLSGSSSGSAIGAFGRARAPQRLTQATRVVAENLPLGCRTAFSYLT